MERAVPIDVTSGCSTTTRDASRSGGVEDVVAEAADGRTVGVAEVAESEEIFDAAQQPVVVVRGRVDATGSHPAGHDDGADPPSPEPGDARQRRVRAGSFAATRRRIRAGPLELGFVECDHQY